METNLFFGENGPTQIYKWSYTYKIVVHSAQNIFTVIHLYELIKYSFAIFSFYLKKYAVVCNGNLDPSASN